VGLIPTASLSTDGGWDSTLRLFFLSNHLTSHNLLCRCTLPSTKSCLWSSSSLYYSVPCYPLFEYCSRPCSPKMYPVSRPCPLFRSWDSLLPRNPFPPHLKADMQADIQPWEQEK
jgi:hypothetical protein